jgi:hypothetical protein
MTRRPRPEERATFRVVFRVEPHVADATRALQRGLKFCLRACGLRCVDAVEVRHDTANQIADAFTELRRNVRTRRP